MGDTKLKIIECKYPYTLEDKIKALYSLESIIVHSIQYLITPIEWYKQKGNNTTTRQMLYVAYVTYTEFSKFETTDLDELLGP